MATDNNAHSSINRSNDLDEKTFWQKAKEKAEHTTLRQRILGSGTLVILAIAILSVVVPFAIDPSTFTDTAKRNAWIVRTVLLLCFGLWGIIAGEKMAEDTILMQKGPGTYTDAKDRYQAETEKVKDIIWSFDDWFVYYEKQQLRRKKIDILFRPYGISDAEDIVDYIDRIEDPMVLCDHNDGEGNPIKGHPLKIVDEEKKRVIIISTKTERQAKAIYYLKKGNVELDYDSADYYKTADGKGHYSYLIEATKKLDDRERRDIRFSRMWKFGSILVGSVFFGLVTFSDFMNANDGQAWMNLVSRIAALVTSFVSGWLTADRTVKTESEKIGKKIAIFEQFRDDYNHGKFKALNPEEKARKEEEEYEREKEADERRAKAGNAQSVMEGDSRQSDSQRVAGSENQGVSVPTA